MTFFVTTQTFFCARLGRVARGVCSVGGVLFLSSVITAMAAELKVLDGTGLVRAIKVVKNEGRVVISLKQAGNPTGAIRGECIATNVDGLASEQRVAVSAQNECKFSGLSNGSWQIAVPPGVTWRAQIYE